MKAIQFFEHGDKHVLQFTTNCEKPSPGKGEVLIHNHASSVNRIDQVARVGYPGIPVKLPHILGGDVCGVIEEFGEGVEGFERGQRVLVYPLVWCGECPLCLQGDTNLCINWQYIGLHRNGGYAEYLTVPADNCILLPENISFEAGAAIPVAGITAYHGLKTVGELNSGQVFFMWGGAGGVGTWAIQIAKQLGVTVIATASSDEKLELMRQLGADHVINRTTEDVAARVKQFAPFGVDLALDYVGPATFGTTFDLIKKGGKILLCGILTGREATVSLHMTYLKHISIRGLYLGTIDEMRQIVEMVSTEKINSHIGEVMDLKDAAQAHEKLENGDIIGKLILKI